MRKAVRNGILIDEDQAVLPVTLRSVQYAYSCYEALKLKNGEFVHLDEHLRRLDESLKGIGIVKTFTDEDIRTWLEMLKTAEGLFNETFRILVVGERPNIVFITHQETRIYPSSYYDEGVGCITYQGERFLPNYKTSNLLLSYLALESAEEKGCFEALFVNRYGYITEGTRSNFYALKGKKIYTAPDKDVLLGVTRIGVSECADELGLEIVYEPVYLKDAFLYDSLFISSTSMKAIPIKELDGKAVPRKSGDLVKELSELVGKWE